MSLQPQWRYNNITGWIKLNISSPIAMARSSNSGEMYDTNGKRNRRQLEMRLEKLNVNPEDSYVMQVKKKI